MRVDAVMLRNVLYLWTVVPMNLGAGVALFSLVVLWSIYGHG